jgi:hypothetical protein
VLNRAKANSRAMPVPVIGALGEQVTLQIRQGATLGPFEVLIRNPDASPVDMTGSTVRGQIRRTGLSAEVIASFDVVIVNSSTVSFTWGLTDEVTAGIAAGEALTDPESEYVYDVEWQDAAGEVHPVFYGRALVLREVTRA